MERIFVIIGRINSLLFLVALLAAVGMLGWSFWSSFQWQQRGTMEVAGDDTGKAAPVLLRFGQIQHIAGANTQMVELREEGRRAKLASGGHGDEIRNVLFLSGDDRKARWLFPAHDKLVLVAAALRAPADDCARQASGPAAALYFEYVSSDSDGDGRLSAQDLSAVALARPDGSGVVEVLGGLTRVLARELVEGQRVSVIYQRGRTMRHARFALPSMAQELDEELVTVPERR